MLVSVLVPLVLVLGRDPRGYLLWDDPDNNVPREGDIQYTNGDTYKVCVSLAVVGVCPADAGCCAILVSHCPTYRIAGSACLHRKRKHLRCIFVPCWCLNICSRPEFRGQKLNLACRSM